ncbi:MAG: DUF84 family protein [Gaiellaceae bacterium]
MAILGSASEKCTLCRASDSTYVAPPPSSHPAPKSIWGLGRTGVFRLPPTLGNLVEAGMELGQADDVIFNRANSKQGSGAVGILTNGMIDRKAYYVHAMKLAMITWIRPELYIGPG